MEVIGQLLVVLLEEDLGGALHGFGSDPTHCGSKYSNILLKSINSKIPFLHPHP